MQCCYASLAFLTDPIGMGQGVEPIEKDGEITGYRAEIMLEKATYEEWFDGSFTKTVCGAKNRNQLLKAKTIAEELGLVENSDFFPYPMHATPSWSRKNLMKTARHDSDPHQLPLPAAR